MNDRVTKNYFKDGGDTLVIGGKLIVEEDAEVEGLDTGGGDIPVATKHDLGGVRVGTGLDITASGTLSVASAAQTLTGGVKRMPHFELTASNSLIELEAQLAELLTLMVNAGMMAPED